MGKYDLIFSLSCSKAKDHIWFIFATSVPSTISYTCCCCCCCCQVASVVSDSVQPHRRQPTKLPRPWDSPSNNTGVGCHFLLQCMKVKSESEVVQLCLTLSSSFLREETWSLFSFCYCLVCFSIQKHRGERPESLVRIKGCWRHGANLLMM